MNICGLEIKSIQQTCYASPSQWDAFTVDNDYLYIRYRFGQLTVTQWAMNVPITILRRNIGDALGSVMTTEEMLSFTKKD